MRERWRPVRGLRGYEVSDKGRVRSYWHRSYTRTRPWICDKPQRILKPKSLEYPTYTLSTGTKRRVTIRVHTLVLEAFVGPKPKNCVCRHLNDNKWDNRLVNLAWGPNQLNWEDSVKNGTVKSVLTRKLVRQMRREYTGKFGDKARLARKYKVSFSTAKCIVEHIRWRYA